MHTLIFSTNAPIELGLFQKLVYIFYSRYKTLWHKYKYIFLC